MILTKRYGMVFYFHTQGIVKDALEIIIHELGIFFNIGAAICLLWEYYARERIWPALGRCLMVISLGTWFIHAPFTLYDATFPGAKPNPKWDRNDIRNVHFMISAFALHILMNLIFIYCAFFSIYCCMKKRKCKCLLSGSPEYKEVAYSLQTVTDEQREKTSLMESDDEV